MGNLTRVEGDILITPPITWKEIQEKKFQSGFPDNKWLAVKLAISTEEVETDEGTLSRRQGVSITPSEYGPYKAYGLVDDIQAIIDAFPGHEFTGYMECWGEETGDFWRVYVKNGEAVRVEPEITWPEDQRTEG